MELVGEHSAQLAEQEERTEVVKEPESKMQLKMKARLLKKRKSLGRG